jgi:hypothetical protein
MYPYLYEFFSTHLASGASLKQSWAAHLPVLLDTSILKPV